jgi:hypothetical protein
MAGIREKGILNTLFTVFEIFYSGCEITFALKCIA